ncbi:M20 family metallo-hydrolase [Cytobacillus oceanisediminis]|uniref:M20 family metallo-hydrolase n=1 Tax=Cytobacillus TaxID=2675230 RepID=UPI0020416F3A|nr:MULTISPECIES: M20 family metallo-hydrolase [Cytobacillus]MBY0159331.1 M20 family metallo-hydrolase [Cytobacillus firmus]MCM3391595.1 M20 family metallo-hydrolase [Cytobacillus oceanisediminis]MCM3528992.1 M20 family metallo-hydrolase [Cytobacillus oceanisediminis]UQX53698.1 M20 family metallo-hydrolase [Cytobacillus pseudoceanisediminis]
MNEWLDKYLKALNLTDSMNQAKGFCRLGYTEEEWRAIDVFVSIAEDMGLKVRRDEAGNAIARWEAEDSSPAVATGSHVDTVKGGGGYDGVAGVLCGLAAVKKLKEEGFEPASPIEVICFASEESSRFGVSTIGSKAMSGLLNKSEVEDVTDEDGITIRQAVEGMGLSWEAIEKAERPESALKSFIELHIEQGTRIEDAGADFGAVTAVACPIRLKVIINGQMGHTGTTPMGKRKDAFVAAAPLVSFISETALSLSASNAVPIVATASTFELKPNAMNVIPGTVELGVDIRSVEDSLKKEMEELIREKCLQLSESFGVKIEVKTLVHNPSVQLDEAVMRKLQQSGETLGYKALVLESGAGHDVMNMAAKWPSGLLFIPCKNGLSHHPEEFASIEDLRMGTEIIAQYLKNETSI